MARVIGAKFSVIWTTLYASVLVTGDGKLVTRQGYSDFYRGREPDFDLPWNRPKPGNGTSQFWFRYLGATGLNAVSSDAAWERVVPLAQFLPAALTGPMQTPADAEVFLYPHAIAVIVTAEVTGEWSLRTLGPGLKKLRDSSEWTLRRPVEAELTGRLDRLAAELRGAVEGRLASAALSRAGEVVLTIAAPTIGEGRNAEFAIIQSKGASACLASLAALGPPGILDPAHLLEENSNSNYDARVYVLNHGHAVWQPRAFLGGQADESLDCLLQNQADLVAQVSALGALIGWASDTLAGGSIGPVVKPLIRNATLRLLQLHAGDERKTYRSGLAKVRIAPLLPALAVSGTI